MGHGQVSRFLGKGDSGFKDQSQEEVALGGTPRAAGASTAGGLGIGNDGGAVHEFTKMLFREEVGGINDTELKDIEVSNGF